MTIKPMDYDNLPKAAQAAARRIAKRTGETPWQVARRTASVFFRKARYTATDGDPLGLREAPAAKS